MELRKITGTRSCFNKNENREEDGLKYKQIKTVIKQNINV